MEQKFSYYEEFKYYKGVAIVSDGHGPWRGGYVITVKGKNFQDSEDLVCKFNRTVVPATWWNDTALICTMPRVKEYNLYTVGGLCIKK